MEQGLGVDVTPEDADKVLTGIGPLEPGEVIWWIGSCNNLGPSIDRVVITSLRTIGYQRIWKQKWWELPHDEIESVAPNVARGHVAVRTRGGRETTFKSVPTADVDLIGEILEAARSGQLRDLAPPPASEPAPKGDPGGQSSNPEILRRVEAVSRVAEALAIAAYRTDSAEDLAAGYAHGSGGRELMPSQITRTMLAYEMLAHAEKSRALTEGDAQFVFAMLEGVDPNRDLNRIRFVIREAVARNAGATPMTDMAKELAVWARSDRDDELAASLLSVTDVAAAYGLAWEDAELLAPLPIADAAPSYSPPLRPTNTQIGLASGGSGIPVGGYLAMFVVGIILTAMFWGLTGVVVAVLIGLAFVAYDNFK